MSLGWWLGKNSTAGFAAKLSGMEALARELGFDLFGVCSADPPESAAFLQTWLEAGFHGSMDYMRRHAELRADLGLLLPGVRSCIVVGVNYFQPQSQPKIARYAQGRDYHRVIRGRLKRLAVRLKQLHPDAEFRACVDSAPVFERELAMRAGLGWLGKNSMLINTRRGSWFLLGVLLTTHVLEPTAPSPGGCGRCMACVEACPTGAIVQLGGRWTVDSRRCISYRTIEHRGELDDAGHEGWVFGCDICQEVCPFNHPRPHQPLRAALSVDPDFQPRAWPTLVELAQLSEEEWDGMTRGSATRRASAEQWRRNARLVLQQSGGSDASLGETDADL